MLHGHAQRQENIVHSKGERTGLSICSAVTQSNAKQQPYCDEIESVVNRIILVS